MTNDIGLVAQEVHAVVPEAAHKPQDESKDLWAVEYDKLIPVLIKAIQEQQEQIDALKQEVETLKSK